MAVLYVDKTWMGHDLDVFDTLLPSRQDHKFLLLLGSGVYCRIEFLEVRQRSHHSRAFIQ